MSSRPAFRPLLSAPTTITVRPYTEADVESVMARLRSHALSTVSTNPLQQSTGMEASRLLGECITKPSTSRGWVAVSGANGAIVGSIFGRQWGKGEPYEYRDGSIFPLFDGGCFADHGTAVAEALIEEAKSIVDDGSWIASAVAVPLAFNLPDAVWLDRGYVRMPEDHTTELLGCETTRKTWVYVGPKSSEQSQIGSSMAIGQV